MSELDVRQAVGDNLTGTIEVRTRTDAETALRVLHELGYHWRLLHHMLAGGYAMWIIYDYNPTPAHFNGPDGGE